MRFLQRGQHRTLPLVQHAQSFQRGVADNLQAAGAQLVEGILRRVVEDVVIAVVEIDHVEARHPTFYKGQVIVFDSAGKQIAKMTMAEPASNLAWGDADFGTLYVTSRSSVYRIRMAIKGSVQY